AGREDRQGPRHRRPGPVRRQLLHEVPAGAVPRRRRPRGSRALHPRRSRPLATAPLPTTALPGRCSRAGRSAALSVPGAGEVLGGTGAVRAAAPWAFVARPPDSCARPIGSPQARPSGSVSRRTAMVALAMEVAAYGAVEGRVQTLTTRGGLRFTL